MRAFRLTIEQAEIFYTLCHEFKADTEEKRLQIMELMAKYGEVEGITQTSMSPEAYVEHLSKQFGNVLRVSSKEDLQGDTTNGNSIGFKLNPLRNPGIGDSGSDIPGDGSRE